MLREPLLLWIDRHLHKNGGSTVREVMLRNEEAGRCVYYGYTQTHEGWRALMAELYSVKSSTPKLPALCIEAHASTASSDWTSHRLPAVIELRARLAALTVPARIVLTTRVREPLSYYMSFYRWRIAGMQRANNTIRLSATRTVVNPLGSGFLDWAPPNLQATGLLHGDVELFAGLKAGGFPGVRERGRRPHQYWARHHNFGKSDFERLLRVLSSYDVVAPLEHFDAALLLVSQLSGLPPLHAEEHRVVVPGPQGVRRSAALSNADLCPDLTRCRGHVARTAPWDGKMYRHVRRAFAARLLAQPAGFAARLEALRAVRAAGGGVCKLPRCCCSQRRPCFNTTRRERTWREPPACVPGSHSLHQLVAQDMPMGRCCTRSGP